jgi:hypothetical protein
MAIAGESWEVYGYVFGEGQRAMIRFDLEAGTEEEHTGHPHCRTVFLSHSAEEHGADYDGWGCMVERE